jgi:hypothetical protein
VSGHARHAGQPSFDFAAWRAQLGAMSAFATHRAQRPCRDGIGRSRRPALLGLLPALLNPDPRRGKRG